LTDVVGFESGELHRDPSGQVVHAELRWLKGVVWLHRVAPELRLVAQHSLEAASHGISLQVSDVDQHYRNARSRGAVIEREPMDMPYGVREYALRDPEGHAWWISSPIA
jgi:uncharacterized glyoxalase superfamily protein PhnB